MVGESWERSEICRFGRPTTRVSGSGMWRAMTVVFSLWLSACAGKCQRSELLAEGWDDRPLARNCDLQDDPLIATTPTGSWRASRSGRTRLDCEKDVLEITVAPVAKLTLTTTRAEAHVTVTAHAFDAEDQELLLDDHIRWTFTGPEGHDPIRDEFGVRGMFDMLGRSTKSRDFWSVPGTTMIVHAQWRDHDVEISVATP